MFSIYNSDNGVFNHEFFFSSFAHFPIIYLSLAISFFKDYMLFSCYLFKPNNNIITIIVIVFTIIINTIIIIIIIVMLINISVAVILEKSSGGEFQARNSSGMIHPY